MVRHQLAWMLAVVLCAGFNIGCGSDNSEPPAASAENGSAAGPDDGSGSSSAAAQLPADPQVTLETSLGSFTVRLDAEKAPLTVDNFLSYVESGHYDGTIFHQVHQGYVILGGGYTPELTEKPPGVEVRNEAHNGLSNRRGTIAMARAADSIDSSTCQFFINLTDNTFLDHQDRTPEKYGYCVFGEVIDGLDVVQKIAGVTTESNAEFDNLPVETVLIKSARRLR